MSSPPEEAGPESEPSTPRALEEDPSPAEKEAHPRWERTEARLEKILGEACTRLAKAELRSLRHDKQGQQCLLTFSAFPVGAEVKKQAVTYWWSARFKLALEKGRGADGIFTRLSGRGYLEPIKNRCSGVIYGCRVHPLVHWMMKLLATEKQCAALDDVLCLTAGNLARMEELREDGVDFAAGRSQDQQDRTRVDAEIKKVILNIDAHVYQLPEALLTKLNDRVEVLQLGRWGNTHDKTYMELEALESLSAIGKLKNLRYLSMRGLSRLTELPREVRRLRRLAILDVSGCQDLVKLPSATVKNLAGLTHLDLTGCYMLAHIGRGVAALSELRVFKGFVFSAVKRRRDACRLHHLTKLKKLWKLSINVTTDADIDRDEMAQLRRLSQLISLTVTWGERPSILLDESQNDKLRELLKRWTSLVLPPNLGKLDVRCYPKETLPLGTWLNGNKKLTKLYVRGGEVKELDIPGDNVIETLRLRYLKEFELKWTTELLPKLNRNTIRCVEIVDKDSKVMKPQTKGKVELKQEEGTEKEKLVPIQKRMNIPVFTMDEHGVWVRDLKEEEVGRQTPGKAEAASGVDKAEKGVDDAGKAQKEVKEEEKPSNLKGTQGENEQPGPAKEDNEATGEIEKLDGGDKNHEIVNKENDNKREAKSEEHNPMKQGAQVHEPNEDENKVQASDEKEELKEDVEKQASPTLAVDQTVAPAREGDIKKGAITDKTHKDKISEIKEERGDEPRDAKGRDEPPSKEDTGDTDEPQTEGEDEGKDDEQPADEDGDTTTGDATSSQASKPKEETTAVKAAASPLAAQPALPPASTGAAPAAEEANMGRLAKMMDQQAPARR
ncbi:hypothetical protein CFC21_021629 [Triticum aestivum]|uniref:Disease resistance R13L4/SHOC-2-like LRR domain-containing protein n=2 Tax=Triticum aestivum TaxID=4565 RepID=A0A9R1EA04_WHEAT|nr:uncharacterized protein LOC123040551 [Triticum aestivum]KAF7006593.1 hypothetical protein CFC21_021629 [Triticum aestivum]